MRIRLMEVEMNPGNVGAGFNGTGTGTGYSECID